MVKEMGEEKIYWPVCNITKTRIECGNIKPVVLVHAPIFRLFLDQHMYFVWYRTGFFSEQ